MLPPIVGNNTLVMVTPVLPLGVTTISVDTTSLPYIIGGDSLYTQLEITLNGYPVADQPPINYSPTSATFGSPPTTGVEFLGTVGINVVLGQVTFQVLARNYNPLQMSWSADIAYPVGYRMVDANGYVQVVLSATGNSGATKPVIFTTAGAANDTVASITGVSVLNNILSVVAKNNFAVGQTVYFTDLQLATFLNSTSVVIATASSTGFTAVLANPNYTQNPLLQESGQAGILTVDGGVTWVNAGFYQVSPTTQFLLIPVQSGLAPVIGPPSGINSYKSQVACRVEWVMPTFAGTVGTKVVLSTDPAGVNPPYVQYGDVVPTTQISRVETEVLSTSETTNYNPTTGQQVITTTNQTQEITYNYVDIPPAAVNGSQQFYAMLSTLVQSPDTNTVYESQQNGPVTCGFVNLALANPVDFLALQRKEDIAGRLITQMTQLYPNLNLTPKSEIRDLLIDPVSIELSNMSVREWFARCSQSVSAISQIDNASGNGLSDPFNSSPIKQQISRAFGLNAADTQTFINQQFDNLGAACGLTRGGATASVVTLTLYSYTKPTTTVTFPTGIICSTSATSSTPSINFQTTGSASITPSSAATFYNPTYGWWAVNVPASAQSTGSSTDVGAGTINSVNSNAPSGWNVTNLVAATFGVDDEINSHFASRIQNRLVTGVDTGTRGGYLNTATSTPGIVAVEVVAAGDLEMVRDWDPIRQKHVYGCVDIYCQGTSSSEEDDIVAFQYENNGTSGLYTSYLPLTIASATGSLLKFQVNSLAFQALEWPLYQGVEILVSGTSGSFYLNVQNAQFDQIDGYIILDPSALSYQIPITGVAQVRIPYLSNLAAVLGAGSNVTYALLVRLQSPLSAIPTNQPVQQVNDVIGQTTQTGTIPEAMLGLVHNSDFLLLGGSNQAGDEVQVISTPSNPVTKTLTASTTQSVLIDTGMDVPIDQNGNIGNILSVLSTNSSTSYLFGPNGDYTIVAMGPYHTYGIALQQASATITNISITGGILTVTCSNRFGTSIGGQMVTLGGLTTATFLNTQQVAVIASTGISFTAYYPHADYASASDTGTVTGYAIQNGQQIVMSYNQFILYERLSFALNEPQTLKGSVPNTLDNNGFVYNTWLPESYGTSYGANQLNGFTLTLDGAVYNSDGSINVMASTGLIGAGIPHDSRYIKVVIQSASSPPVYTVMEENVDFILSVDKISGSATIARNLTTNATSRIPDGGQVLVSYFYNEAFDVATEYPSFVPVLLAEVNATKHAAASVLVKSMVANPIDITLTVTLQPGISPSTLDPDIRTAIDQVLDNAKGILYQSQIVSQVQAVQGVQSVALPLIKCAKSDGSYDIAVVIPTGTAWTPLATDPIFAPLAHVVTPTGSINYIPSNSFITTLPVLPDPTIPSGGPANDFVGFLYEGQAYGRTLSPYGFLTNAITPQTSSGNGSFYIIGTNDQLVVPNYNGSGQSYTVSLASYAQKVIVTIPLDTPSPSLKFYFTTYVVEGSKGASDITLSSTEYFVPGLVVVNYQTS